MTTNKDGAISAITALRGEHVAAVNKADLDEVLRGMTDDVVYLAPGVAPVRGKPELEAFLKPLYASLRADITMTAEETIILDDHAFEWGHLRGVIQASPTAPRVPLDGKYVYLYRRGTDGAWRIARDAYNDNGPAPAESGLDERARSGLSVIQGAHVTANVGIIRLQSVGAEPHTRASRPWTQAWREREASLSSQHRIEPVRQNGVLDLEKALR